MLIRYTYVNQEAARFLRRTPEELLVALNQSVPDVLVGDIGMLHVDGYMLMRLCPSGPLHLVTGEHTFAAQQ